MKAFLSIKNGAKDSNDNTLGHGRVERGGHGLPEVSPGPALLYLSMPCGQATYPLKRPNGRFRGCPPAGREACGRLLPLLTPHAIYAYAHDATYPHDPIWLPPGAARDSYFLQKNG
jgi:hypothetical protein